MKNSVVVVPYYVALSRLILTFYPLSRFHYFNQSQDIIKHTLHKWVSKQQVVILPSVAQCINLLILHFATFVADTCSDWYRCDKMISACYWKVLIGFLMSYLFRWWLQIPSNYITSVYIWLDWHSQCKSAEVRWRRFADVTLNVLPFLM